MSRLDRRSSAVPFSRAKPPPRPFGRSWRADWSARCALGDRCWLSNTPPPHRFSHCFPWATRCRRPRPRSRSYCCSRNRRCRCPRRRPLPLAHSLLPALQVVLWPCSARDVGRRRSAAGGGGAAAGGGGGSPSEPPPRRGLCPLASGASGPMARELIATRGRHAHLHAHECLAGAYAGDTVRRVRPVARGPAAGSGGLPAPLRGPE